MDRRLVRLFQSIGHGYKNDAGDPERCDDDEAVNPRANPHHDLLAETHATLTYQTLVEKGRAVSSQPLVVGA